MAVFHCIGITIDEKNDTASYNVPGHQDQRQVNGEEGGEVWKAEGIICLFKANNFNNYFAFFLELHKIVAVEDDQTRSLPYFVSYRLPQRHNHTRDKQCFKGSLKTWRVCEVGGLLVMYGLYS